METVTIKEFIAIAVIIAGILHKAGVFKKLERGRIDAQDIRIKEIVGASISSTLESDATSALLSQKVITIVDEKIREHTRHTSENVLSKMQTIEFKSDNQHTTIEKMFRDINNINSQFEKYEMMINNNKETINEVKSKMEKVDTKIDNLSSKIVPYGNSYGELQ